MATDISSTINSIDNPSPRLWTRDEYYRLAEQGYFDGQRVELIEGEIVVMSPPGNSHVVALSLVHEAIYNAFPPGYWIRNQAPLALNQFSEPQPDLAVLAGKPRECRNHPHGALLAIEVSDSSRAFDLRRKANLYAASSGVPEYWVVDLVDRILYVMLDPRQGEYRNITRYDLTATVTPTQIPAKPILVGDLFP